MSGQTAVVALTDQRWYEYLRSMTSSESLDEVNFWRPLAQSRFRALAPGEPFFLRLKSPHNCIAAYGYFAHSTKLPIQLAWNAFEWRNGDPTYQTFLNRIAEYRRESPLETALGNREVTCLVLRGVKFLPEHAWLGWGDSMGFRKEIVAFKTYDLTSPEGLVLTQLMKNGEPAEFAEAFSLVDVDERMLAERVEAAREGQGSFRVRVLDAYGRRCAVTGERALPTIDAAHIQPYRGPASNHIQNGLALRADVHRLYDSGYVTITPDYRFEVSARLKDDFDNGEVYFGLSGESLRVLPREGAMQPSREALDWHATNVFRGR